MVKKKFEQVDTLTLTGWLTICLGIVYMIYLLNSASTAGHESEEIRYYIDAVALQMQQTLPIDHSNIHVYRLLLHV